MGVLRAAFVIWDAGQRMVAHEGFELSGYTAFTSLLSLFPFLLFLTALAGFLGNAEIAENVLAGGLEFVPEAVVDVLRPVIVEVLTQRHGSLLTLGIVFSLWSASSSLEALRTILNRSYGVIETRPIWILRPQSILLVVVGAVIALLLAAVILGARLLLSRYDRLGIAYWIGDTAWTVLRYGLAGTVTTCGLVGMHRILPNANLSLHKVLPGAAVTSLLWLSSAGLFSIYVSSLPNYSIVYGSLGGIVLTLLFFYLTAIMFAYGAEVNAAWHARR